MSAALKTPRRMTVLEFMEMTRTYPEEERWELLDGEPVLMPPPTERHQIIVANLMAALRTLARARGCRVLPGLGLLNDEIDSYAPIPDVVARCGPVLDGGYARDPVLLAEVLSPSTMNNDRGRKVDFYHTLATLRTTLVVYQDEVRVEAWQRNAAGEWQQIVRKSRSDVLALPELEGELTLSDIYEDVPLS